MVAAGCSKEKAAAIKVAAETARTHAVDALRAVQDLVERSIAVAADPPEEKIRKAAAEFTDNAPLGADVFKAIVTKDEVGEATRMTVRAEMEKLRAHYVAFANMFSSLPAGSYLAADAVKKAEHHAIRMATEFISHAQSIPAPQFTAERTLLIERINQAAKMSGDARAELIRRYTIDALNLRAAELEAKDKAVVACLRAAAAFKATAELIRDYKKITAADMMTMTKELLSAASDISGQHANVQYLLDEFTSVKTAIENDPHWSAVLNTTLKP